MNFYLVSKKTFSAKEYIITNVTFFDLMPLMGCQMSRKNNRLIEILKDINMNTERNKQHQQSL